MGTGANNGERTHFSLLSTEGSYFLTYTVLVVWTHGVSVLPLLNLPVIKVHSLLSTVHIMACCGASLLSRAAAILHVSDSQSRDTTDLGHVDTRTAIQRLTLVA